MASNNITLLDQFEVGGTFFELIEFSLERLLPDGQRVKGIYGVNVAKVREVVHMPQINPLASRIPGVSGVFELRGVPIPAINLTQILGDRNSKLTQNQQIIVTEFSAKRAGFIVSSTHRIRRVAWDRVMPPSSDSESCMSGMILIEDNNFLFLLDLEKILFDIESKQGAGGGHSPYNMAPHSAAEPQLAPMRSNNTDQNSHWPGVLVVDDSKLVLTNVSRILRENHLRVITATNGAEALETLEEIASGRHRGFGKLNCMVTDVEMPLMDGLTLTKNVRAHDKFGELPILLHTSLSGEVTQTAAQSVGADGYIVKNDIRNLSEMVNNLLKEKVYEIGG